MKQKYNFEASYVFLLPPSPSLRRQTRADMKSFLFFPLNSVRAYRHHFDRWGVTKYNRRTRARRPAARPAALSANRVVTAAGAAVTTTNRRPLPTSPSQSLSSSSPSSIGSGGSTITDASGTTGGFLSDDAATTIAAFSPERAWATMSITSSPPTSPPRGVGELAVAAGPATGEHTDEFFHALRLEPSQLAACRVGEWAPTYPTRPR